MRIVFVDGPLDGVIADIGRGVPDRIRFEFESVAEYELEGTYAALQSAKPSGSTNDRPAVPRRVAR
ncbi:MAG TPA: hypothetical protein VG826_05355 [Pirellulales bacterium]|nr:hypothetical protein [Pirellulales bacterium]